MPLSGLVAATHAGSPCRDLHGYSLGMKAVNGRLDAPASTKEMLSDTPRALCAVASVQRVGAGLSTDVPPPQLCWEPLSKAAPTSFPLRSFGNTKSSWNCLGKAPTWLHTPGAAGALAEPHGDRAAADGAAQAAAAAAEQRSGAEPCRTQAPVPELCTPADGAPECRSCFMGVLPCPHTRTGFIFGSTEGTMRASQ